MSPVLGTGIERAHWNGASIDMEAPAQLHYADWDGGALNMEVGTFYRARWTGAAIEYEQIWPVSIVAPSLAIAVTGTDSIQLTITDNSRTERNWQIHRSTSASFTAGPSTLIDTIASTDRDGTGGTQTYDDTGLSSDTYYYQVLGENGEALSAASNEVSASVIGLTQPAYTVSYPQDNSATDDSTLHRFDAMDPGASHIQLVYKVGSDFADDQDPLADGTNAGNLTEAQCVSAAYDLVAGSHGDAVYATARFVNGAILGPWLSASVSATVSVRLPGQPASIAISGTGVSNRTVTWTAGSPDNETQYRLQSRSRACGGSFGAWGSDVVIAADTLSDVRPVLEGFEHEWRVRAENAAGNSAYRTSSTETVTVAPGVPTGLSATYDATNPESEGDASWSAATGTVDGYDIRYRPTSGGSWTEDLDVSSPVAITGLADDTEYEVQVRSFNDCGEQSAWSSSNTFWTAPAAPSSLSWFSDPAPTDDTHDEIEFATAGTDADDIEVYYIAGTSGTPDETDTLTTSDTNQTGLSANSPYRFRFRARNQPSGGSPHSASDWAWVGTTKQAYTHVDAPQITAWSQDAGSCPTIDMDLTVSHTNTDSDVRSQAWEYRTRVNAGSWSSWTGVSAGTATVNGITPGGSDGDTIHVETRYSGETDTDSASQAVLCAS